MYQRFGVLLVAVLVGGCAQIAGIDDTRESPDAAMSECGNGRLEPGETCDDDNRESGDGCSADCLSR